MFLIRQSKPEDVSTLLKLARMVYFINLPPHEHIILDKINHSVRCFRRLAGLPTEEPAAGRRKKTPGPKGWAVEEESSDFFIWSIVDTESDAVIGTSQVRAHQGGPGNPNWSMRVTEKTFYSESLRFGTTHTVGRLHADESGPTEIGGLILQPSHRGHKLRPGRLLSFARFHFIALHRRRFADRILAEMMGPVTSEGDNAFWDALGRKFIPVKYVEADRFCQHNRQFIQELFPKDEIYLTLLPLEVVNNLGVVPRETIPARRMLESLGFEYRGFIDPFDGGPHLDAPTDGISLVRDTRRARLGKPIGADKCDTPGIVSVLTEEGEFRAIETRYAWDGESPLRISGQATEVLLASPDMDVGVTPMTRWYRDSADDEAKPAKKRSPKKVKA